MSFKNRDIISITDFSRKDLIELFKRTDLMLDYRKNRLNLLEGKILASAFFEPSTRTRLSFETAMKRLGGDVISFSGSEAISIAKGENLADTIRMLDSYANIIVIRHKYEGAAKLAAEIAECPVINGGDGKHHHPTQAMLDLYTIWKLFGKIDGLNYAIVGDLKYARTAASLVLGLIKFKPQKIYLISPPQLKMKPEIIDTIEKYGIEYEELNDFGNIISTIDVMYVTRIQKERFPDPMEYEKVKGSYNINLKLISKAKETLRILHPLPKIDEIDLAIDQTKFAAYFTQAAFGVPLRMALLSLIFGVKFP